MVVALHVNHHCGAAGCQGSPPLDWRQYTGATEKKVNNEHKNILKKTTEGQNAMQHIHFVLTYTVYYLCLYTKCLL